MGAKEVVVLAFGSKKAAIRFDVWDFIKRTITPSKAPPPRTGIKYLSLAPATRRTTKDIPAKRINMEKFGCNASKSAEMANGTPGCTTLHFKVFISVPASESLVATMVMRPSFKISEG